MCLIIQIPARATFPDDKLRLAVANNHDGFGVMWHDGGKVRVFKMHDGTQEDQYEVLKQKLEDLKGYDLGVHLRWRTHGYIDAANTHPYQVLNRKQHKYDCYMMHNGVINTPTPDKSKSDTWHFITNVLRPLVKDNPKLIHRPAIQGVISKAVGDGNKLLLLDERGKFVTINKFLELGDCLISNTYSFTQPTRALYEPARSYYGYRGSYGAYDFDDDWRDYGSASNTNVSAKARAAAIASAKSAAGAANAVTKGTGVSSWGGTYGGYGKPLGPTPNQDSAKVKGKVKGKGQGSFGFDDSQRYAAWQSNAARLNDPAKVSGLNETSNETSTTGGSDTPAATSGWPRLPVVRKPDDDDVSAAFCLAGADEIDEITEVGTGGDGYDEYGFAIAAVTEDYIETNGRLDDEFFRLMDHAEISEVCAEYPEEVADFISGLVHGAL